MRPIHSDVVSENCDYYTVCNSDDYCSNDEACCLTYCEDYKNSHYYSEYSACKSMLMLLFEKLLF